MYSCLLISHQIVFRSPSLHFNYLFQAIIFRILRFNSTFPKKNDMMYKWWEIVLDRFYLLLNFFLLNMRKHIFLENLPSETPKPKSRRSYCWLQDRTQPMVSHVMRARSICRLTSTSGPRKEPWTQGSQNSEENKALMSTSDYIQCALAGITEMHTSCKCAQTIIWINNFE